MATDAFISYSRKNKEFAFQLVDALKSNKHDAWIDTDAIPPSAEWWAAIKQGIDEANSFVVILTPESLSSPVCTFEMDYAIKNKKRIVPVMRNEAVKSQAFANIAAVEATGFLAEILGEADLLDMARDNWRVVEKLNWINLRETDNFDVGLRNLLSVIEQDPAHVREHTRLLVRAREWDANGRKAAYALRGEDLREAEIWQAASAGKQPPPNDLHTAYILASQQVRKDEQSRNRALTQARFGIVLAIALLAILGFVFVNLRSGEQTSANATLGAQATSISEALATSERRADEAQSLLWAANAQERSTDEPLTALRLLVEANRIESPSILVQQGLADLSYAPGAIRQFIGHNGYVRSMALNADGQRFITVGSVGEVFLWDVAQSHPLRQFSGHSGSVESVAWNADGQRFITVGDYGEVFLWDAAHSQPIQQFSGLNTDEDSFVRSVAWNADGQRFITVGSVGEVFLWDVAQSHPLQQFSGHTVDRLSFVRSVVWNADGQRFVTVGDYGEVFLWDADLSQPVRQFSGHTAGSLSSVESMAWNADGQRFITVGSVGEVFLWDADLSHPVRQFSGHTTSSISSVESVAWNADGQHFVTVGGYGEVFLWDVAQSHPLRQFSGHTATISLDAVSSVAWNADRQRFVTAGTGGEVFLWDVETRQPLQQFIGHTVDRLSFVRRVLWNADGQRFVTVGSRGEVFLWGADLSQPIRQFSGHTTSIVGSVESVAWNADGQRFVTVGSRGEVFLWGADLSQPVRQFSGHSGSVESVAWNADGQRFVTVGDYGEVFL